MLFWQRRANWKTTLWSVFLPWYIQGLVGHCLTSSDFWISVHWNYVNWFLVGWKFGVISPCREKTFLSSSRSEEGRNEVFQIQGELPVHWQKKSAVVSMATQCMVLIITKEAKYICLYCDFFHMCIPFSVDWDCRWVFLLLLFGMMVLQGRRKASEFVRSECDLKYLRPLTRRLKKVVARLCSPSKSLCLGSVPEVSCNEWLYIHSQWQS